MLKNFLSLSSNYNRESSFAPMHKLVPIDVNRQDRKKKKHEIEVDDCELDESDDSKAKIERPPSMLPLKDEDIKVVIDFEKLDGNLSAQQISIVTNVLKGRNTFITGGCNTRKTMTISKIKEILNRFEVNAIVIAASNDGAILLQCDTVNSAIGAASVYQKMSALICEANKDSQKWITADVLVMDNVGHMPVRVQQALDRVLRSIRKCSLPYGGICVVSAADLAQMPHLSGENFQTNLFFDNPLWHSLRYTTYLLGDTPEGKAEIKIVDSSKVGVHTPLLYRVMTGRTTADDVAYCKKLVTSKGIRKLHPEVQRITNAYNPMKIVPMMNPPRLCTVGEVAARDNEETIKKLQPSAEYRAVYKAKEIIPDVIRSIREKCVRWLNLIRNDILPSTLSLAIGTPVINVYPICMFTTDADSKEMKPMVVSKGTKGVLVGWSDDMTCEVDNSTMKYPMVKFKGIENPVMIKLHVLRDNQYGTSYAQLPINVAWSVSLDKQTELTLDSAWLQTTVGSAGCTSEMIIDPRQFYGALSRVRNELTLESFKPEWLVLDSRITDFYRKLFDSPDGMISPPPHPVDPSGSMSFVPLSSSFPVVERVASLTSAAMDTSA